MADAKPSDLALQIYETPIYGGIATDTETSGLFADDGARTSTASVGWADEGGDWREWAERWDNVDWAIEQVAPGYEVPILSVAWPFDQGVEGKPEWSGQPQLWPEAENLDQEEWEFLLRILADHELDMHHSKFDSEKYRVGVRRWPGVGVELQDNVKWDTQNVNDLLWRLHPTSLKPTVERLTGKPWADESAVVKRYLKKSKLPEGRWDLIPWEVIGQYANIDARITKLLELRQKWEIENNDAGNWLYNNLSEEDRVARESMGLADTDIVYDFIQRRLKVTGVLYRMERRGVPYDEVGSRQAAIECRERAKMVADQLPFSPTEAKAKNYFFGEGLTDRGVECLDRIPYSVTEKGSPQLTAEIAGRMVNDRVPGAALWQQYTKVDNAASMWYEGYAEKMGQDGRLRCAFRQNGTRSTRFSVERLNLQAIPQDYRLSDHAILDGIPTPRQLIANAIPDGWRNYELDLAQAELRRATDVAKCKLMEQMIRDGEDLHTFTTKALFPKEDPDGDLFMSKWRQVGKRGNFSLQFGAKGATFGAMVSKETGIILGETESDRVVREWNALYPEFGRAIRKHQDVVAKRQARHGYGWVTLVNGERRWFQPYEEAHKAFNQRVQGDLAQFGIDWLLLTDPFLMAQTELHKRAKKDGIGEPGLVLTIHDSQNLLLPDDEYGRDLAQQCAQFGRDLWKRMFPGIPGDVDFHAWDRAA